LKDFRITRRLSEFRLLVGAVLPCAVCHIHVWLCGGFDRSLLSPDALYLKYSKGAGNAWACCMTESECSRSSSHTYSDKQIVSGTGGQRAFHFCTYYTSLSLYTQGVPVKGRVEGGETGFRLGFCHVFCSRSIFRTRSGRRLWGSSKIEQV